MSQSQKRPHTDTQSHLPPPPTKPWVNEDFTLFDEGECSVSDMDQSLFDGQLSELTDPELSDWKSESELGWDEGNTDWLIERLAGCEEASQWVQAAWG